MSTCFARHPAALGAIGLALLIRAAGNRACVYGGFTLLATNGAFVGEAVCGRCPATRRTPWLCRAPRASWRGLPAAAGLHALRRRGGPAAS